MSMRVGRLTGDRRAVLRPGLRGLLVSFPAIAAFFALAASFLTRVVLSVVSASQISAVNLPFIFGRGLWFDLVMVGALMCPFALVHAIMPDRWRHTRPFIAFSYLVIWLFVFFVLSIAIGEYLFWDEFSTRYNFIAVDYLVYTQEVLANIMQSYPVKSLLAALAAVAAGLVWLFRGWMRAASRSAYTALTRVIFLALALAGPAMAIGFANVDQMRGSGNAYADELAGNGMFTFVTAFFSNELDYDSFYATLPQEKASAILAGLGVRSTTEKMLEQTAPAGLPPTYLMRQPKNVVLVTVESLSAEFLGVYGNKNGLTPNLDRLSAEGMSFDRLFATGTRTVRGLEAVSVGTPPTPGNAIVRRPNNENLTTVGGVLQRHGFKTIFAYGGDAFFDNMAAYFGGNGYDVVDEPRFPKDSITFQNAWGVADEVLFKNAVASMDAATATGSQAFIHIMTTSNHRPFTYPDGKIDILSPGGREGAVKYTDYAIGAFIAEASTKPWFKDTVFIIVADHCASAAGKTELPIPGCRIPAILYAPGIIRPGHVDQVASQMDIAPTILRLLGIPGESYFFGRAIDGLPASDQRAFISTYEALGYYKADTLTVLRPKQQVETFRVDPVSLDAVPAPTDPVLRDEAIAYYQIAAKAFKEGGLKQPWEAPR